MSPTPESPAARSADGRLGLRSGSVRLRVTLAVIIVLAVVLAALSFAVTALFLAQSERNLDTLLSGRAQLARQLARTGIGPQQIVNRVAVDGVQAELRLRNGTVLGAPVSAGPRIKTVQTRLVGPGRAGGAVLTLSVDTSLLSEAQQALRRLLLVAAVVALAVSAVLVTVIVRFALKPLDAVAGLARSITQGRRGGRLHPVQTDTEIGQTALALDEMLDELEGAEQRARQAEEGSRTFLADAAHELRTPIAGVQAAAETLLHNGPELTEAQREQLEVLLIREATRAGRLVSDLLTTARLDAGLELNPEPTSLRALAAAELDRARLIAPRIQVDLTGPDLTVLVDRDKISDVLRNLVDNALRAAGPRGWVRIALATDGRWASAEVTDSGPGIAAEDRERIFDRLVRLDSSRESSAGGSGLGLPIARGWARAHGGDLVCLPPSGFGARFALTLPLAPDPASTLSAPEPTGR